MLLVSSQSTVVMGTTCEGSDGLDGPSTLPGLVLTDACSSLENAMGEPLPCIVLTG